MEAAEFWLSCQWVIRLLADSATEMADFGDSQLKSDIAAALGFADAAALETVRDALAADVTAAYVDFYGSRGATEA
jgi:hypothetical protein